MTCDLTNPIFSDETAACAHMESDRWPNGVNCPFCGSLNVHRASNTGPIYFGLGRSLNSSLLNVPKHAL